MCVQAGVSFADAKTAIIVGLNNSHLADILTSATHFNFDDLYKHIQAYETVDTSRRGLAQSGAYGPKPRYDRRPHTSAPAKYEHPPSQHPPSPHPSSHRQPAPSTMKFPRVNDKQEPLCFNCLKYGHIGRDCKEASRVKATCSYCRKTGHTVDKCFKKSHVNTVQDCVPTTSAFEKPIEVNGRYWLRGLVDSGATCCLIRESAATICNMQRHDSDALLVGFGSDGNATKVRGACQASISIDGTSAKVKLFVVSDVSLTHDVIIGESFLTQRHVAMLKVGDRFVIGRADQEPFANLVLPPLTPSSTKLSACNNCVVKSNSVMRIEVQSEDHTSGHFVKFNNDKSATVFDVINGSCPVTVLNKSPVDIHFKTGQCVARAQRVPEVNLVSMEEPLKPPLTKTDILTVLNKSPVDIHFKTGQCVARAQRVPEVNLVSMEEPLKPPLTKTDICIDSAISDENVSQLLNVLNAYRDIFADSLSDVGCTHIAEMKIEELPDSKPVWGPEQQGSFEHIKKTISETPALKLYHPNARTELHTDACAIGLAAMLLQEGEDSKMHLVYCASKRTNPAEEHYHSSKLELAAIVWALTRLRQFLLGIKFTVYTDCEALIYLNAKKTINPQVARGFALTQEFDMEVKHRPGVRMAHVDALSRAPVEQSHQSIDDMVAEKFDIRVTLTLHEQILTMQKSDPEMIKTFHILAIPPKDRSREETHLVRDFSLRDHIIYKKVDSRYLFVVPPAMRKSLVVKAHDLSGHFSVERTVSKLMENYWFPGLRRYVKYHVSHCFECIANKTPSGKRPGLLHPIPPGKRPFETIHLDHLGPFVTSSRGNKFLLLVVDNLTKFVRLYATKDTSSRGVLFALNDFVMRHGLPERCITDRGTAFTALVFAEFCRIRGILHILISTRHPRANGQVERVNRTVLPVITSAMTAPNQRDWDKNLQACENALNCAVNASTKKSPFELLHGYKPRFHDGMFALVNHPDNVQWTDPSELQAEARQEILSSQNQMKLRFDEHHCTAPQLIVGQLVFLQKNPEQTGQPTKTQIKYRGPLVITKVLPGDTYQVTSLLPTKGRRFFTTNAHILLLKPWGQPDVPSLDTDTDSDPDETEDCEVFNEPQSLHPKPKVSFRPVPSGPVSLEPNVNLDADQLGYELAVTPTTEAEVSGKREVRRRRRPRYLQDFV
ncbi:hypothetical protein B566_EDAN012253 [Ephemera danica]|nr:hypothetical protein B566_EDAN012253 [Ephemera danica]